MPTIVCPKCGLKVSFSKMDKFENVHKCRQSFRDAIQTKPPKQVETKKHETKVSDIEPGDRDSSEAEKETESVPNRDRYNGRKSRSVHSSDN